MIDFASVDKESNSVALLLVEGVSGWVFLEQLSIVLDKMPVWEIGTRRSCHPTILTVHPSTLTYNF